MIHVNAIAPDSGSNGRSGGVSVTIALLLSDKPLGFVALLGVLALTGMIARNSVILIDQKEKAHGRHPWDAVVEATAHRFRSC